MYKQQKAKDNASMFVVLDEGQETELLCHHLLEAGY